MVRLGLDVGGTKTAAMAVDEHGAVIGQATVPTDTSGSGAVVETILAVAGKVLEATNTGWECVTGIGIGLPGQVDPAGGTVKMAVNLNVQRAYPLGKVIAERTGVPVILENDVRTATLGAFDWLQRREAVNSITYLSIGTGIAAGVIIDGRLYRGSNGMAGEIGHLPVAAGGLRCACGAYGCLETVASGPAIRKRAMAGNGLSLDDLSTAEVVALARRGDAVAQEAIDFAAGHLARALYFLVLAYDTERVVIGGGVSQAGDAFWVPVNQALNNLRSTSSLAAGLMPDNKFVRLPLTYSAGIHGALQLAGQPVPVDGMGNGPVHSRVLAES